jgi:hypothetical protein
VLQGGTAPGRPTLHDVRDPPGDGGEAAPAQRVEGGEPPDLLERDVEPRVHHAQGPEDPLGHELVRGLS